MEYKEFSAKTVNDCITEACTSLGVPSDRLDYEVVSEGTSGFLGIGAKSAVIRARVKDESAESEVKETVKEKETAVSEPVKKEEKKEETEKKAEVKKTSEESETTAKEQAAYAEEKKEIYGRRNRSHEICC